MKFTPFFKANIIPKIEAEFGNSDTKTINKILKAHYGGAKNWYDRLLYDDMQIGCSYQKGCYRAIELILAEHYGLTHPDYKWKENRVSYEQFVSTYNTYSGIKKPAKYYDTEMGCWCYC